MRRNELNTRKSTRSAGWRGANGSGASGTGSVLPEDSLLELVAESVRPAAGVLEEEIDSHPNDLSTKY